MLTATAKCLESGRNGTSRTFSRVGPGVRPVPASRHSTGLSNSGRNRPKIAVHDRRRERPFPDLKSGVKRTFSLGPRNVWKQPEQDIRRVQNRARPTAGIDPNQSFKPDAANVRFRIAKQTLLVKRSFCAAATVVSVLFNRRVISNDENEVSHEAIRPTGGASIGSRQSFLGRCRPEWSD